MRTGQSQSGKEGASRLAHWCRSHSAGLLAASAVCLVLAVTGGTYAYFTAADRVVNELDMSRLTFEIEEPEWEQPLTPVKPGDVLPKDPQITNTGEMDFVVRVRVQEVWTLKDGVNPPAADQLPQLQQAMKDETSQLVRYFASNREGPFKGADQELLNILKADKTRREEEKYFSLLPNLRPNQQNPAKEYWDTNQQGSWYHGKEAGSPWFYYDQVVKPGETTVPLFRAVAIRSAGDYFSYESVPNVAAVFAADPGYSQNASAYNSLLSKYNLDIYIYAETCQAEPFAWGAQFKDDIPAEMAWQGGVTGP